MRVPAHSAAETRTPSLTGRARGAAPREAASVSGALAAIPTVTAGYFEPLVPLSAPLYPKLMVGDASDPAERAADAFADRVMGAGSSSAAPTAGGGSVLRRKCSACEEEDGKLHRKETAGGGGGGGSWSAPPVVHQALASPGHALDAGARGAIEGRGGVDLSGVRVHTDSLAAESARAVGARAYTVGSDLVFGAGEYRPGTSEGLRLIAHEVGHLGSGVVRRETAPESPIIELDIPKDYVKNFGGPYWLHQKYYPALSSMSYRDFEKANADLLRYSPESKGNQFINVSGKFRIRLKKPNKAPTEDQPVDSCSQRDVTLIIAGNRITLPAKMFPSTDVGCILKNLQDKSILTTVAGAPVRTGELTIRSVGPLGPDSDHSDPFGLIKRAAQAPVPFPINPESSSERASKQLSQAHDTQQRTLRLLQRLIEKVPTSNGSASLVTSRLRFPALWNTTALNTSSTQLLAEVGEQHQQMSRKLEAMRNVATSERSVLGRVVDDIPCGAGDPTGCLAEGYRRGGEAVEGIQRPSVHRFDDCVALIDKLLRELEAIGGTADISKRNYIQTLLGLAEAEECLADTIRAFQRYQTDSMEATKSFAISTVTVGAEVAIFVVSLGSSLLATQAEKLVVEEGLKGVIKKAGGTYLNDVAVNSVAGVTAEVTKSVMEGDEKGNVKLNLVWNAALEGVKKTVPTAMVAAAIPHVFRGTSKFVFKVPPLKGLATALKGSDILKIPAAKDAIEGCLSAVLMAGLSTANPEEMFQDCIKNAMQNAVQGWIGRTVTQTVHAYRGSKPSASPTRATTPSPTAEKVPPRSSDAKSTTSKTKKGAAPASPAETRRRKASETGKQATVSAEQAQNEIVSAVETGRVVTDGKGPLQLRVAGDEHTYTRKANCWVRHSVEQTFCTVALRGSGEDHGTQQALVETETTHGVRRIVGNTVLLPNGSATIRNYKDKTPIILFDPESLPPKDRGKIHMDEQETVRVDVPGQKRPSQLAFSSAWRTDPDVAAREIEAAQIVARGTHGGSPSEVVAIGAVAQEKRIGFKRPPDTPLNSDVIGRDKEGYMHLAEGKGNKGMEKMLEQFKSDANLLGNLGNEVKTLTGVVANPKNLPEGYAVASNNHLQLHGQDVMVDFKVRIDGRLVVRSLPVKIFKQSANAQ